MSTDRDPRIKNLRDIQPIDMTHGAKFGGVRRRLAAEAGSRELGCSWYELAPGRQSYPHHYHFANEEAFFILSGNGTLRLGAGRFPVGAGDYIACPAGSEAAHALINTGSEPLRYLSFSTVNGTDVFVYPDSRKVGVAGGADMHKGLKAAPFFRVFEDGPGVDYFQGEE